VLTRNRSLVWVLVALSLFGACAERAEWPEVKIAGAMRNVMMKGELGPVVRLDTIDPRPGLYGLGPLSFLRGELLLIDGTAYVSRATSDSTLSVESNFDVSAPFLVYAQVEGWRDIPLPERVRDIVQLEEFLDTRGLNGGQPFPFRLTGRVESAGIHTQDLPPGTEVRSPADAHQGQKNFRIEGTEVEIVGFFSRQHQGIFTHMGSLTHMHLITKDHTMMGHLDELRIGQMKLWVPARP